MDIYLRCLCFIFALLPVVLLGNESLGTEGDDVIQPAYGGSIENTGKGVWIIDPANSGLELPAVGQSLFDLIFSVDGRYQWPLWSLLCRMSQWTGAVFTEIHEW